MGSKLFELVSNPNIQRSNFDLSHTHATTMNFGTLCPIMIMEVFPGDRKRIAHECLIRFAPMVVPPMHQMFFKAHTFFCPTRILWDNFEEYIAKTDATPGVPHVFPYVEISNSVYTRLHDYMGLPRPAMATGNVKITATQLAVYQCVYDQYYRDQNLVTNLADKYWKLINGDNDGNAELRNMRNVSWEHDYLTSCLPTPQKGDPAVLPIAGLADLPVYANSLDYGPGVIGWDLDNPTTGATTVSVSVEDSLGTAENLFVPFSQVDATVSIAQFREAYKTQEWLERALRGGSRYIEVVRSHFGVRSSDARFQRPEYICGIKTPIIVSEVLQTSETDAGTPQGNMAGHGVSSGSSDFSTYFAEEHGYIITIAYLTLRSSYQNGVDRQFLKYNNLFEFYWPEFAQLSEQAVYNIEAHIDHATPFGTFGYIPRYAEYKFMNNRVSGDFRQGEPLDYWTLTRELPSNVALNQTFIEITPEDTERIFAVQDGTDPVYVHVLNSVYSSRLMPFYGDPLQL